MKIAQSLISTIREACQESEAPLALHEPLFQGKEWDYTKDCLDSGWVSSVGAYVDRFEQMLADFTESKHAVAVVNGTCALHALIYALDLQNNEILTPSLTFVGTTNAIMHAGAIPHFVDADVQNLGVCPDKLAEYLAENSVQREGKCHNRQTGKKIGALIAMHTFGIPARVGELAQICAEHNILFLEDAAEAIGSRVDGKHVGAWGVGGMFSFNGNKTITCGGGGAVVTNDSALAKKLKHLTNTARVQDGFYFTHDAVGFNYRMPNINAALGVAQLEQLPNFLVAKRHLAERYRTLIERLEGFEFLQAFAPNESNHWLNAIRIPKDLSLEPLLNELNSAGIQARPLWRPMHHLPMFAQFPKMNLDRTEELFHRIINLPSSVKLGLK